MGSKTDSIFDTNYLGEIMHVDGILFTPREIDIMACLLNARGTSRIAAFLSISPKTVANHIQNIMGKLSCHSRESIIDFLEKTKRADFFRAHYNCLLRHADFEKALKILANLTGKPGPYCTIVTWEEESNADTLIEKLRIHLETVGIRTLLKKESGKELSDWLSAPCGQNPHIIYILSSLIVDDRVVFHSTVASALEQTPSCIFLLSKSLCPKEIESFTSRVNFIDAQDFHFIFFEILRRIIPSAELEAIISEFEKKYGNLILSPTFAGFSSSSDNANALMISESSKTQGSFFVNVLAKYLCSVGLIGAFFLTYGALIPVKSYQDHFIRSDIVIPNSSILLARHKLLRQIDKAFNLCDEARIVAIIGPGGAGKTTLARQYAQKQRATILWEINAETLDSLQASFEKFAERLAKDDIQKRIFKGIQEIKNPEEKKEALLDFIAKHLKLASEWFLLLDNLEDISYLNTPLLKNISSWGNGHILITTRNTLISHHKLVPQVVTIEELDDEQKVELFTKIQEANSTYAYSHSKLEEMRNFLAKLPSFPLDISIAANYLRSTKISYTQYLEELTAHRKEFERLQKDLLNISGDYIKTRHEIITASIAGLIKEDKNFEDLILFVSLIDSQQIPRSLLEKFKDSTIVDAFIFNLQKYSLITDSNLSSFKDESLFSVHRSTQEICLDHLLKALPAARKAQLFSSIANAMDSSLVTALDNDDFPGMKLLLPHAEAFLTHTCLMSKEIKDKVAIGLAGLYSYQNQSNKVKILVEPILESLSEKTEKDYDIIAKGLIYLGNSFWGKGDYLQACKKYKQGIKIYKRFNEDNTAAMGFALLRYGHCLIVLGQVQKAREVLEEVFKIYELHYPKHHAKVANCLCLLGYTYCILGLYGQSIDVLEQSLSILKQHYPDNYMGISRAELISAEAYRGTKQYAKALNLYEQGLKNLMSIWPDGHYSIMWASYCLGATYKDMGEFRKAKAFIGQALEWYQKKYPADYFITARIKGEMGHAYLLEGDLNTADALLTHAGKVLKEHDNPYQYSVLENLAELDCQRSLIAERNGNLSQAQNLKGKAIISLNQAASLLSTHFSKDSPHFKRVQDKLDNLARN